MHFGSYLKLAIIPLIVFLTSHSFAQIDKEFWFAVPEVTDLHGDRPVYLRITSYEKNAEVTISQPANRNFKTINITVNANSLRTLNLTSQLPYLENTIEDYVNAKGLYIKSTEYISVVYEVSGTSYYGQIVNSDIFTLKGNYALGTTFYTPFQNFWNNKDGIDAYSSFDIVATEDNTIVTIIPSRDVVGHKKGIPYQITMNKGETYSARAVSYTADAHPAGSYISSTKPIALTIKDDSVFEPPSYDLAGDQIIPVNFVGTEYIAVRATQDRNFDKVFICATQDSTEVYINGNPFYYSLLNAGQTEMVPLSDSAMFIRTTKPSYAFHMAGFNTELAGALLPTLQCTGSRRVSFVRTTDEPFSLTLLVKTGGEGNFNLNGSRTNLDTSNFHFVPGTNNTWMFAHIFYSESSIPFNQTNTIINTTNDFHLGIMNGSYSATGFRYGYFSDYGSLELGSDLGVCEGDKITIDAGPYKDSYAWSTGSTDRTVTVKDSGYYSVTITKGTCLFKDSVHVAYNPEVTGNILGNDTVVCVNTKLVLKAEDGFQSYTWQNGGAGQTFTPKISGWYSIEVTNEYKCRGKDSLYATLLEIPDINISTVKAYPEMCYDSIVSLQATPGLSSYFWNTGDTTDQISSRQIYYSYSVKVTGNNGCTNADTLELDCSPVLFVPNLITPNDDNKNDLFILGGLKQNKWELSVYNRWGGRIYFNDSYDNTWNGHGLTDGVYFYELQHKENKGQYKGWIQVEKKIEE